MSQILDLSGQPKEKKSPLLAPRPMQVVELHLYCPDCKAPCPPLEGHIVTQGEELFAHQCVQCGEIYHVPQKFPVIDFIPLDEFMAGMDEHAGKQEPTEKDLEHAQEIKAEQEDLDRESGRTEE